MTGFATSEFQARCARAQTLMQETDLAALLLTTEPDVRYFTGFLTRFWESPTRPWFLVLPASGKPVAVIPSIGRSLMHETWVSDIRCWPSPDLDDDGVSLLADTLCEVVAEGERVGVPDGHETHVRMPLADLQRVDELIGARSFCGDGGVTRRLRMIKSNAEVAKIANACQIAGRAFARVPEIATEGTPLDQVFRHFQMLCLEEGADWVPYLAGGAGAHGYLDVISPASQKPLSEGNVLMLDTGLVHDGYFCDFDRNWSVGPVTKNVSDAYARLIEATDAGAEVALSGATASTVFNAMNTVLTVDGSGTEAGRLGHGLGMSLTEWPSLIPTDDTVLEAGMVLTLEPGITVSGTQDRILVHEENILITDGAPCFLSPRAEREMICI